MARRKSLSKAHREFVKKMKNLKPDEKEKLETVEKLALELMKEHNVSHYNFKFGYGWTYAGMCTEISIIVQYNFVLKHNIEEIKNTVLHEIAHAIVGPGVGHHIEWQNKAKELGVKFHKNYRK